MKRALGLCLCIFGLIVQIGPWLSIESVPALNNSITIRNNYTADLTNWPIFLGRWFARGEITDFCQPFATPSGGSRAAIAAWQCDVLARWPDQSAARNITYVRIGATGKIWSTGGNGLSSAVITGGITALTFAVGVDPCADIELGDALVVSGAPTNSDWGPIDNAIVQYLDCAARKVYYLNRSVVGGAFKSSGSYSANLEVSKKIDPLAPPNACVIGMPGHGFFRGDPVSQTGLGANGITMIDPPGADGNYIVTMQTQNEVVLNARCSGTYSGSGAQLTGTNRGTGSVRHAFVAFKTLVPNGTTTQVDWVNNVNPSSAGNAAATAAAGFDKAAMLADTSWNADLVTTADVKPVGATASITTSPRTMLTNWNGTQSYNGPRFWCRGPVMTCLILEYAGDSVQTNAVTTPANPTTLPYDFGYKIRPATTLRSAVSVGDTQIEVNSISNFNVDTVTYWWTTDYNIATWPYFPEEIRIQSLTCATKVSPCITLLSPVTHAYASGVTVAAKQWEDATAGFKSLHPRFYLRFINGFSGVGTRTEVENERWRAQQSLWYSFVLNTGATPSPRHTQATFKHLNFTSWQFSTWNGTDAEFYCTTGGDPDGACPGGVRKRLYLIDHNSAYLMYARAITEYKLFPGMSNSIDLTGFSGSDKGQLTTGMGGGTFGNQPDSWEKTTPYKGFDGAQEAFVYNSVHAHWMQSWSEAGYEINFCDSCPGGAGNVESGEHIPWMHREDEDDADTTIAGIQSRYYLPGYGAEGKAIGRRISIYGRPTYIFGQGGYVSASTANVDKPSTACAPTIQTPGIASYPCYYEGDPGREGWIYDQTHIGSWSELSYLITADPRYLDMMHNEASWAMGWEPSNRGIGKSWSQPDSGYGANGSGVPTAVRGQGGWVRAVVAAAIHTPNVPQFGMSSPIQAIYYNKLLWDTGLAKEGFYGIRDGWFSRMYPVTTLVIGTALGQETFDIMPATCPTPSASSANTHNPSIWNWTRCTRHIAEGRSNPLGIMGLAIAGSACPAQQTDYHWWDCDGEGALSGTGFWYFHHTAINWSRAARLGLPMFDAVRLRWHRLIIAMHGSDSWNPFFNFASQIPFRKSGQFAQTLEDMKSYINETWDSGARSRGQIGFCYDPGEGHCNNAYANTNYLPQFEADLASYSDLRSTVNVDLATYGCQVSAKTPRGCTWENAWNWTQANHPQLNLLASQPKFAMWPYSDIRGFVCTPGGTTATCKYTAPDRNPCYHRIATTAPTTTLDDTDVSDGGGAEDRIFVITGLTQGILHYDRLSCGQRFTGGPQGTGRAFTTFTTLTTGSATTITMTLPAVFGATTVTLAYGSTTAVTTGTMGPTTCTSGCTFAVPGVANQVLYTRATYKNAGGTTIGGVPNPKPVLVP